VAAKAAGMRQATAKATRSRAVEALLGGLAAGALLLDDADEEGCRWAHGTAEGISMAPRALTTASYEPSPPLLAFLRAAFYCLSFPSALLLAV
jgi:hypothetical protein